MDEFKIVELSRIQGLRNKRMYLGRIIDIMLSSINDWPNAIESLEEFENEVKSFIGNDTTYINIKQKMETIDFANEAWQSESLSQLIEIFQFFCKKEDTLVEVIKDIKVNLINFKSIEQIV